MFGLNPPKAQIKKSYIVIEAHGPPGGIGF